MTKPDHITGSPAALNEHATDGQRRGGAGVLLAPATLKALKMLGIVEKTVPGKQPVIWLKCAFVKVAQAPRSNLQAALASLPDGASAERYICRS